MASGLFIDPMVLLRAAPLVSSTCTLLFARDQDFFLRIFNDIEQRKLSKSILTPYFTLFFNRGVYCVLLFIGTSTSTGIANVFTQPEALHRSSSFWWYVAGAALSTSHLLYAPAIAPSIGRLMQPKPDTDENDTLDEWLSVNKTRGWTVDLGAWLAFTVAVAKTLHV